LFGGKISGTQGIEFELFKEIQQHQDHALLNQANTSHDFSFYLWKIIAITNPCANSSNPNKRDKCLSQIIFLKKTRKQSVRH